MTRRRRGKGEDDHRRPDLLGSLYPTLDLHGLTGDEAVSASRRWLAERRRDSDLTVRLITGRGLHSIGPAILPGEIENLLRSIPDVVAGFERESGGGVFRIRLAPPLRRSRERPVPSADPAVVREAEEALADLGIVPTPALVDVEIRRIVEERAKGAE